MADDLIDRDFSDAPSHANPSSQSLDDLLPAAQRERPSRHGALLGEALTALYAAGKATTEEPLPELCSTCAFRAGCMTNMMAATGLEALNCTLGIDPDHFACHHGMKDGRPTKPCVGYFVARLAPFDAVKSAIKGLAEALASVSGPDTIRAEFDAWVADVDPSNCMDDYARGRAFLRRALQHNARDGSSPQRTQADD